MHEVASATCQVVGWIASARRLLHSRSQVEREFAVIQCLSHSKVREAVQALKDEGRTWRRLALTRLVRRCSVLLDHGDLGSPGTLRREPFGDWFDR